MIRSSISYRRNPATKIYNITALLNDRRPFEVVSSCSDIQYVVHLVSRWQRKLKTDIVCSAFVTAGLAWYLFPMLTHKHLAWVRHPSWLHMLTLVGLISGLVSTMLTAHASCPDKVFASVVTTDWSWWGMTMAHTCRVNLVCTSFIFFFALCLMQTPPLLDAFGHPSWLHVLIFAPCLQHTPPLTTRFVHPSWLHGSSFLPWRQETPPISLVCTSYMAAYLLLCSVPTAQPIILNLVFTSCMLHGCKLEPLLHVWYTHLHWWTN